METLTRKQKETLDFIEQFSDSKGYSPSLREVAEGLRISLGTVQDRIAALKRKDFLTNEINLSRTLNINKFLNRIPIYSAAKAGQPRIVDEEIKDFFDPNTSLGLQTGDKALEIDGDSMIGAGIPDGSTIFFRLTKDIKENDIVVVRVDDGVTVKTFSKKRNKIILKPENSFYKPIELSAKDNFEILGKVVCVVNRFQNRKK